MKRVIVALIMLWCGNAFAGDVNLEMRNLRSQLDRGKAECESLYKGKYSHISSCIDKKEDWYKSKVAKLRQDPQLYFYQADERKDRRANRTLVINNHHH